MEFENEDARSYRLFIKWNSEEPLERIVERLNNFESINIELKDHKMTVK